MENLVDLKNLREITGGDAEIEAQLFHAFLDSSAQHIAALRTAFAADDGKAWRQAAHALKGICLNIGAMPLGDLCSKAQSDYLAPPEDKEPMLAAIESGLSAVQGVINKYL